MADKIKQELSVKTVEKAILYYLSYRGEMNLRKKEPEIKWKGDIQGNKFEGTVDVEYYQDDIQD